MADTLSLRKKTRRAKRPFWSYLMLRLQRPRTVDLGGIRVSLDPTRMDLKLRKWLLHGDFEASERIIAQEVIAPGDRVLEGGAGLGVVSLTVARIVGADRVTSYEPAPNTFSLLEDNCALNRLSIDRRNRALGAEPGKMQFGVKDNVLSSSLEPDGKRGDLEVEVDGINDALAETGANVLILDVEGAEVGLIGACDLQQIDKVVMEVHPQKVGHDEISRMISRLISAGLVWRLDFSSGSVLTFLRPS